MDIPWSKRKRNGAIKRKLSRRYEETQESSFDQGRRDNINNDSVQIIPANPSTFSSFVTQSPQELYTSSTTDDELFMIKRLLRSGPKPLAQVAKRMSEYDCIKKKEKKSSVPHVIKVGPTKI
ncbi:hypothetical protein JYU34_002886 [Plutella xylostella]|uniref:Uncharacterized protein n=1 Tax=Plutella xylostella TaxID=51655 RepID=A0ABQ7R3E5_PLUXY|nr:hypothetical protein JYU34_002886 [Plutella xylostella]